MMGERGQDPGSLIRHFPLNRLCMEQIQWPSGMIWYPTKAEGGAKRRENGAQGKPT